MPNSAASSSSQSRCEAARVFATGAARFGRPVSLGLEVGRRLVSLGRESIPQPGDVSRACGQPAQASAALKATQTHDRQQERHRGGAARARDAACVALTDDLVGSGLVARIRRRVLVREPGAGVGRAAVGAQRVGAVVVGCGVERRGVGRRGIGRRRAIRGRRGGRISCRRGHERVRRGRDERVRRGWGGVRDAGAGVAVGAGGAGGLGVHPGDTGRSECVASAERTVGPCLTPSLHAGRARGVRATDQAEDAAVGVRLGQETVATLSQGGRARALSALSAAVRTEGVHTVGVVGVLFTPGAEGSAVARALEAPALACADHRAVAEAPVGHLAARVHRVRVDDAQVVAHGAQRAIRGSVLHEVLDDERRAAAAIQHGAVLAAELEHQTADLVARALARRLLSREGARV